MKTKHEIEMDFNRACMQADELMSISKKISGIVDKSGDALNMLSSGWTGSNACKFIDKSSRLENEMLGTADDLKRIAESVRKTAKIIYNAEKIAIQLGY